VWIERKERVRDEKLEKVKVETIGGKEDSMYQTVFFEGSYGL